MSTHEPTRQENPNTGHYYVTCSCGWKSPEDWSDEYVRFQFIKHICDIEEAEALKEENKTKS